jgi:hypothetical protein
MVTLLCLHSHSFFFCPDSFQISILFCKSRVNLLHVHDILWIEENFNINAILFFNISTFRFLHLFQCVLYELFPTVPDPIKNYNMHLVIISLMSFKLKVYQSFTLGGGYQWALAFFLS